MSDDVPRTLLARLADRLATLEESVAVAEATYARLRARAYASDAVTDDGDARACKANMAAGALAALTDLRSCRDEAKRILDSMNRAESRAPAPVAPAA